MCGTFVVLFLTLSVGCKRGWNDSWDSYASSLTTNQPKQDEVVGSYLLTQQTITTNGLAVLQGRQCELYLRPDGFFTVTNYPTWTNDQFKSLISATGRWQCDTVGIVYSNQPVWGIRFSEGDHSMDLMSFTGSVAPYALLMTYSDPDENEVMIFNKKK